MHLFASLSFNVKSTLDKSAKLWSLCRYDYVLRYENLYVYNLLYINLNENFLHSQQESKLAYITNCQNIAVNLTLLVCSIKQSLLFYG